jgi:hypothetical protein
MTDGKQTGNTPEISHKRPETGHRPLHKSREYSRRTLLTLLTIGDVMCFMIFVSIGSNQHGEGFNLLYSLWLVVPFLLAWFVVSPLLGVFQSAVAKSPGKMVRQTLLAWLCTWPVAMALRWLLVDRIKTPPTTWSSFLSFAIVTLIFNTVMLLIWRWPFAFNYSMRSKGL